MNVWPHPNISNGWKCPVCKTNADKPVVLVPFRATDDPMIVECKQVHKVCFDLITSMEDQPA